MICTLQLHCIAVFCVSDIAMCLYTVTEDNPRSCQLLTSVPSHMEQLEALLSPVPAHEKGHSHMLVVAAAIAGRGVEKQCTYTYSMQELHV